MVADGMTKALPKVRHTEFIKQLRMEDIRNRIAAEALMEEAREKLQEKLANRVPEKENQRDLELKLGAKGGRPGRRREQPCNGQQLVNRGSRL
jgi:hypothetical protein